MLGVAESAASRHIRFNPTREMLQVFQSAIVMSIMYTALYASNYSD